MPDIFFGWVRKVVTQHRRQLLVDSHQVWFYLMAKSKAKPVQKPTEGIRPSDLQVPEDEQRRLINESDLFKRIESRQSAQEPLSFGDEVFLASTLIIPFTSLLILMDM